MPQCSLQDAVRDISSAEVESYISIINEDGKEIAALPDGSYDFGAKYFNK